VELEDRIRFDDPDHHVSVVEQIMGVDNEMNRRDPRRTILTTVLANGTRRSVIRRPDGSTFTVEVARRPPKARKPKPRSIARKRTRKPQDRKSRAVPVDVKRLGMMRYRARFKVDGKWRVVGIYPSEKLARAAIREARVSSRSPGERRG
jgi:hypothetical protein